MRSSTAKQKALMISASTLVMLSSTSVLAQAKDGQKDSTKEAKENEKEKEKEGKKQTTQVSTTTRVPGATGSTTTTAKKKNDDDDDEDENDDDDHATTTTLVGGSSSTTSTSSTSSTSSSSTSSSSTSSTLLGSSTTTPSTTVATTVPLAPILASQKFLASKIGAPIRMDTTVINDSQRRRTFSVVITMSSTGALPGYLEARALTGPWLCSPTVKAPVSPQVYNCIGTLAAKTSGVITVSSGSAIVGNPGQTVTAGAVVSPSGAIASATATL